MEIAVLAGLLAILAGLSHWLSLSLRHPSFPSGWLLMVVLLVIGLVPTRILGAHTHAALGIAALALLCFHMDFGLPEGGYEIALAGLFAGVSASGLIGREMPATDAEPPRWYFVHVCLTWALLGFALIHGILMHAHGLLAGWLE